MFSTANFNRAAFGHLRIESFLMCLSAVLAAGLEDHVKRHQMRQHGKLPTQKEILERPQIVLTRVVSLEAVN